MISKALEEYLKVMYILKKQTGDIRVTDVANKMNCSKASVNKSINSLKENGLVNYETYGDIELTEEGKKLAKKILEAYDIMYVFLKDVIGVEDKLAAEDAEKIKSSLSDTSVNEIAKYIHKALDLNDLNCNYDINNEKCRSCARKSFRGHAGNRNLDNNNNNNK